MTEDKFVSLDEIAEMTDKQRNRLKNHYCVISGYFDPEKNEFEVNAIV